MTRGKRVGGSGSKYRLQRGVRTMVSGRVAKSAARRSKEDNDARSRVSGLVDRVLNGKARGYSEAMQMDANGAGDGKVPETGHRASEIGVVATPTTVGAAPGWTVTSGRGGSSSKNLKYRVPTVQYPPNRLLPGLPIFESMDRWDSDIRMRRRATQIVSAKRGFPDLLHARFDSTCGLVHQEVGEVDNIHYRIAALSRTLFDFGDHSKLFLCDASWCNCKGGPVWSFLDPEYIPLSWSRFTKGVPTEKVLRVEMPRLGRKVQASTYEDILAAYSDSGDSQNKDQQRPSEHDSEEAPALASDYIVTQVSDDELYGDEEEEKGSGDS